MNRFFSSLAFCVVLILAIARVGETQEVSATLDSGSDEGFTCMFNGTDLSGWSGRDEFWSVQEGCITGESTEDNPCDATNYLYWDQQEPGDFVFRCKIKLINGNSGIQFRSEKRPGFDTFGYQADFDDTDMWTGCLFQHRRGAVVRRGNVAEIGPDGVRSESTFATMDELVKHFRPGQFNDYEVEAVGSKITLTINGELMCTVDDRDSRLSCQQGVIALQIHQGPPMKVQFKDLSIKILD